MSDENSKRNSFWGSLKSKINPRSRSDDRDSTRRPSSRDSWDRSPSQSPSRRASSRPRPDKGKGPAQPQTAVRRRRKRGPLTAWPPSRVGSHEDLTLGHALDLISRGAPVHTGHRRPIQHAPDHCCNLYATTTAGTRTNRARRGAGDKTADLALTDAANLHDSMVQLMSMSVLPPGPAVKPWETLEQRPSYAFHYGARPGTVTLNSWVSRASVLPQPMALRDPGVSPRDADLETIMRRLRDLGQHGLEDDDERLMYRNLYRRLLRDPEKETNPHRTLDLQITDLIMVLSRPAQPQNRAGTWIDFSDPRNQVATRFVFDDGEANHERYVRFFHQLLLACELDLRINSKRHLDTPREKLLAQLPPSIQWSIALARRWLDNIRVEKYGETAKQVRLRFRLKNRQMKMLKRFAQMIKWPNLAETLEEMDLTDQDDALGTVSSHAMAFFSGLVLPGPTFPFLMMNSLIDLDPDKATDDLALLTHVHPACGFQYRGSVTYWSSVSVVGKVLAPTCREVGGWVGPARPTTDLARTQIARIRTRLPVVTVTDPSPSGAPNQDRRLMSPGQVLDMKDRSDPLGPAADLFPVADYDLPVPPDYEPIDTVRLVKLSLRRLGGPPPNKDAVSAGGGVATFDAGLEFAVDGVSWPLRLSFDVDFVCAWPCEPLGGPHPLFFEYEHVLVSVDRVVEVHDWGGMYGGGRDSSSSSLSFGEPPTGPRPPSRRPPAARDSRCPQRVLVIEALGVTDNEVLARAWCAHWGLHAVVADIRKTCMACAIREAYAATMTVVILVEGLRDDHRE